MRSDRIASAFNVTFARSHHTVLLGGGAEPYYLPAPAPHRCVLRYRQDFAASALHEAAHWCWASPAMRRRRDFGFWYLAPPRDADQQARFFAAEERVQALERLFADALGLPFQVSVDDPGGCHEAAARRFEARVRRRAENMQPPKEGALLLTAFAKLEW